MSGFDGSGIQTQDQIRDAWQSVCGEINDTFGSVTDQQFNADRNGKWTLAKNLDHLSRSAAAVAKGLGMPKLLLRVVFGRGTTTRSFPEIQSTYLQVLADGGQAGGAFVPQAPASQRDGMDKWNHCSQQLLKNLDRWSEAQMDACRMPHPLLGKLTVREMLFFTIFHTHHHLGNVRSDPV